MQGPLYYDRDTQQTFPFDPNNLPRGWIDIQKYAGEHGEARMVALVNAAQKRHGDLVEVRPAGPGRGYGLFATQKIPQGKTVASYGGVIDQGGHVQGRYIIEVESTGIGYDSERYFDVRDAGRFINEPPYGYTSWANVDIAHDHHNMRFVTRSEIGAGQEIWWDYGSEYDRSAYGWNETLASNDPIRIRIMMEAFEGVAKSDAGKKRAAQRLAKRARDALNNLCFFCSCPILGDAQVKWNSRFCSVDCQDTFGWIFKK